MNRENDEAKPRMEPAQTVSTFSWRIRSVLSGTLLSRLSGLGRDLLMAYRFGTEPAIALFMLAFRLAYLLRRLLAEGPLQHAFIPHFQEASRQAPAQGRALFIKLSLYLFLTCIGLVLLLEGVFVMTNRSICLTQENRLLIHLIQRLLPALVLITLNGLNLAFLQVHHRLFSLNLSPAFVNLLWIVGVLSSQGRASLPVLLTLSNYVVVGFLIQFLFTSYLVWKELPAKQKDHRLARVGIKPLLKGILLGMIAMGATQIYEGVDSLLARLADPSGPAFLWYAVRFNHLLFSLFILGTLQPLIPSLTAAIQTGQRERSQQIVYFATQRLILLSVIASAAIFVLGNGAIQFLLGHGHFSLEAVQITSLSLQGYTWGMLPSALTRLYTTLLFAEKEFKIPTVQICSVGLLNVILSVLLVTVFKQGVVSLALSSSCAHIIQAIWLYHTMKARGWQISVDYTSIAKACAIALFSVGVGRLLDQMGAPFPIALIAFLLLLLFSTFVTRHQQLLALIYDYIPFLKRVEHHLSRPRLSN